MDSLGPAINESDAQYFAAMSNAAYLTQMEALTLEHFLDNATRDISRARTPDGYYPWSMDLLKNHDDNVIADMWEVFYHITDRRYMAGSKVLLDPIKF